MGRPVFRNIEYLLKGIKVWKPHKKHHLIRREKKNGKKLPITNGASKMKFVVRGRTIKKTLPRLVFCKLTKKWSR